jgi:hypothetical protein
MGVALMQALFSVFHRRSHARSAPPVAPQRPHGRSLLAELALGFTPYLLVLVAVLLVGR